MTSPPPRGLYVSVQLCLSQYVPSYCASVRVIILCVSDVVALMPKELADGACALRRAIERKSVLQRRRPQTKPCLKPRPVHLHVTIFDLITIMVHHWQFGTATHTYAWLVYFVPAKGGQAGDACKLLPLQSTPQSASSMLPRRGFQMLLEVRLHACMHMLERWHHDVINEQTSAHTSTCLGCSLKSSVRRRSKALLALIRRVC